ncbi:MAG: TonB-dependent receptor, partial [Alphaproteobacteria bacterium]
SALQLPASNPFSPFGTDVSLLRYLGDDPLTQASSGWTGHLGFSLDKDVAKWKLSLTGNYDHVVSRTQTWRGYDLSNLQGAILAGNASVNPFGPISGGYLDSRIVDRARSTSDSGDIQLVANGPLLDLPAGPLNASFKGGFSALGLDSRSTRSGLVSAADLSRTDVNGRVSFDLPLTSRRNDVLPAIGDLSINVNAAVDRYSDFGALGAYGYGTTWKPRDGISLIFSMTHDRSAPSVQQLGNPQVLTPDVRTYDYLRGVTVDIAQLGGGNPDLLADRRRVMKLGLTLKPFREDVTLSADYVHSRIRNAIAGFPEPTPAIAAAFADRFIRDEDGDLIRIDARAVNFDRQEQSQLRWGMTFTKRLKTAQSVIDAMRSGAMARRFAERRAAAAQRGEADAGRPGDGADPAARPRPEGQAQPGNAQPGGTPGEGPGFRGRGGGQGGRLQFSLFHTWHFKDEILIRRGLPVLDLLDGDAIGATGGTPRHELEAQFTYSNNGLGLRLTGNWQEETTVNAGPASPTGDLRFGSLAKVNARLFVNLAQIPALANADWAQGARISLRIDNLFDTLPRVRDATGATPLQ